MFSKRAQAASEKLARSSREFKRGNPAGEQISSVMSVTTVVVVAMVVVVMVVVMVDGFAVQVGAERRQLIAGAYRAPAEVKIKRHEARPFGGTVVGVIKQSVGVKQEGGEGDRRRLKAGRKEEEEVGGHCIISRMRYYPREREHRVFRVRARRGGTGRTIKSVIARNCWSYVFVFVWGPRGNGIGGSRTVNTLANIANCLMNIYDVHIHIYIVTAQILLAYYVGGYFSTEFFFTPPM